MSRPHSRSPKRRSIHRDDNERLESVHGYDSRRRRLNPEDRSFDSRPRDNAWDRDDKRRRRGGDWPERDHREYRERDRENERERDRDRYYRQNKDEEYDLSRRQRRSASPPSRSSRPRDVRSQSTSPVDKAKPNMAPSGLLAAETNTIRAVDGTSTVLKYNEPPEARKPVLGWRLYVFKGTEQVELLHIHRQSAYLIGRDRLVADIAVDHSSCSKQHAVIQYRYVQDKDEFGTLKGVIKPFVIDLESTNKTFVNDEMIPAARYYELKAGDVIKFGLSTREYVILHDEVS